MRVPATWLKDFTDIDVSIKELADRMTLSGSKADDISDYKLSGVYVGRIISVTNHPDSDHLHILKVDLGRDDLGRDVQIVCGARNVYEGMICPVASVGAILPEITIKKGKIRGIDSFGMCCSAEELGPLAVNKAGSNEYGLWDLSKQNPVPDVGTDMRDYLHIDAYVTIDFEINADRPDCYSVEGLAREAAITLEKAFKPISPSIKMEGIKVTSDIVNVEIMKPNSCYRYCARTIEEAKVGPSPSWMVERLEAAGIHSVNNFIDITNYVCLELGQPIQAYDLDSITNNHITIRNATDGEFIRTSESKTYNLDSSMLVISDENKICSLAGILNSGDSQVSDSTHTILIESAVFDNSCIRNTSRTIGVESLVSSRFELGIDSENSLRALDRACELVELLGCGKVSQGVIDIYPTKREVFPITLRPEWINKYIGINASTEFMTKILLKLGCEITDNVVIPPSYRPDIKTEADIAEEIARFYGYNNIEPTLLSSSELTLGGRTKNQTLVEKIKNTLVSNGFYEALTYSFESPNDLELLKVSEDSELRHQVKVLDPIDDELSVMRTTMLPSMLRIAAHNSSCGVPSAKVFEVANVYINNDSSKTILERSTLSGFMFDNTLGDSSNVFYTVRGTVEELTKILGIRSVVFRTLSENPSFHPGRTASVVINNRECGVIGIIHPEVADNFNAPFKSCFFEIEVDALISAAKTERVYKQVPKYPGIIRELTVVVDKNVAVGDLIKTCKSSGVKLLKEVEFFDVYEDSKIGQDKKSVALSLVFRDESKNLTDADIKDAFSLIFLKLESTYQARLR